MRAPFPITCAFLLLFVLRAGSDEVYAQGTTRPRVRDSNVGYVDSAIPGSNVRFQFDSADDNKRPTRNEFFWSGAKPVGRGPEFPERNVDYQDLTLQLEGRLFETTSVFAGIPVRMLDPELNANTTGLADVTLGLKHALVFLDDIVISVQGRAYLPTADVDRGLGTGHVSLEPGVLLFKPLTGGWVAEAELRDWIPIGGTVFAGNVLRYGAGIHYDELEVGDWQIVPVAEFVGWTSLEGAVAIPSDPPVLQDSAGDTIVNVKLGTRFSMQDAFDIYTGFGRPLTGDTWYESIFRAELRILF